ncbi:MAG: aminotransferase class I/II-fold pyridoxal phosphate-dependent enzyme [Eubacteriales bacterium]|nr:aminotransferase class I/II-fold pyridoxal phosphate-dependent enzyme [Eubacteriales bacterium]
MLSYSQMSREQLQAELNVSEDRYQAFADLKLNLNMTRGKPCSEQLDLSNQMLTVLSENDFKAVDGTDCRNYGGLEGLPEARQLFADMLGVSAAQVLVLGNSSLNLMYDTMARAMLHTLPGGEKPWSKEDKIKFLCPVPGYDRHFAVTQSLGIEMINIPMNAEGPDMDLIEKLVAEDASIKGMWSVPVYSNPDGFTYSAATCSRLASMKTAAPDFRIWWDNAYVVHHLYAEDQDSVPDILSLCAEAGHPDRVFEFSSTSKITYAGAGLGCIATSTANIGWIKKQLTIQTIGPDKINQLRHVKFIEQAGGVEKIMREHAYVLQPKFDLVLARLDSELSATGLCTWKKPKGGYFVSINVPNGTAKEVVRLAKACGVELTPAGATYPYGLDPQDSNIRLAPSFPPLSELRPAMEIFCTCVKLAAIRHLIGA